MSTLTDAVARYEQARAFARTVTLPEEDRARFTSAPWQGGYRWFRSSNVVKLERYRSAAEMDRIRDVILGRGTWPSPEPLR
jgi:hypothetical protein